MKKSERYSPAFLFFTKLTGGISAYLFFKPAVFYESEARPDKKKSAVVISNHSSLIDYVLMVALFPFRVMRFLIAEVMFNKKGVLPWLLYRLGGIRVDRDNAVSAGYGERVGEAVGKGHLIGIFPEGKLNPAPQDGFLEYRTGAAYFALKYGIRVIPVYHQYKYGLFKRTRVMIGDPVDLKELFPGEIDRELLKEATAYLRKRMEQLQALLDKRIAEKERKKRAGAGYRAVSAFVRTTMWPFILLFFRPRFYYTDKSVQARVLPEPCIVVSNHINIFDPPTLCSVFRRNRLHMIAGELLYERPVLNWLLPHCGCIKIDRNAIDMDSFRAMVDTLKKGECVGLFPEGGLNRSGEFLPFKAGMILAAVKTGAPIVPVYIAGEYKVIFGRRQRIVIDVPYHIDQNARLTGEFLDGAAEDIRRRMIELKQMYEKGEMK